MKFLRRPLRLIVVFVTLFASACQLAPPAAQSTTVPPATLPTAAAAVQATTSASPAPTAVAATHSPSSTSPATELTISPTPPPQAGPINPACAYGKSIDLSKYGGAAFRNPEVISSTNGVLKATLTVAYADSMIAGCPVHLRTYNGSLVGPTLRVKPGDTLSI